MQTFEDAKELIGVLGRLPVSSPYISLMKDVDDSPMPEYLSLGMKFVSSHQQAFADSVPLIYRVDETKKSTLSEVIDVLQRELEASRLFTKVALSIEQNVNQQEASIATIWSYGYFSQDSRNPSLPGREVTGLHLSLYSTLSHGPEPLSEGLLQKTIVRTSEHDFEMTHHQLSQMSTWGLLLDLWQMRTPTG